DARGAGSHAHGRHARGHPPVLPLLAAGHGARFPKRHRGVPQRPAMVHRLLPAPGRRVMAIERLDDVVMDEVHLTTPVSAEAIRSLKLGDVVYLSVALYTGREGVYRQVVDKVRPLHDSVRALTNVKLHH